MTGTKFESDNEVQKYYERLAKTSVQRFNSEGIRRLVHRWGKMCDIDDKTMLKKKLSFSLNYKSLY